MDHWSGTSVNFSTQDMEVSTDTISVTMDKVLHKLKQMHTIVISVQMDSDRAIQSLELSRSTLTDHSEVSEHLQRIQQVKDSVLVLVASMRTLHMQEVKLIDFRMAKMLTSHMEHLKEPEMAMAATEIPIQSTTVESDKSQVTNY